MRTFIVIALFACVFAVSAVAQAPAAPAAEAPSQAADTPDLTNLFTPSLSPPRIFKPPLARLQFRTPAPRSPRVFVEPDGDCYTMRSYLMKREDKTDKTRPRGYTTCTPASRFRLKAVPAKPEP